MATTTVTIPASWIPVAAAFVSQSSHVQLDLLNARLVVTAGVVALEATDGSNFVQLRELSGSEHCHWVGDADSIYLDLTADLVGACTCREPIRAFGPGYWFDQQLPGFLQPGGVLLMAFKGGKIDDYAVVHVGRQEPWKPDEESGLFCCEQKLSSFGGFSFLPYEAHLLELGESASLSKPIPAPAMQKAAKLAAASGGPIHVTECRDEQGVGFHVWRTQGSLHRAITAFGDDAVKTEAGHAALRASKLLEVK